MKKTDCNGDAVIVGGGIDSINAGGLLFPVGWRVCVVKRSAECAVALRAGRVTLPATGDRQHRSCSWLFVLGFMRVVTACALPLDVRETRARNLDKASVSDRCKHLAASRTVWKLRLPCYQPAFSPAPACHRLTRPRSLDNYKTISRSSYVILSHRSLRLPYPFADLQDGIADLPLTIPLDRLRKGVLNLAKLAKLFDIPAIVTAVGGAETPRIMAEIEEGLGSLPTYIRTTADSFLNEDIAKEIESSGRKTILIAGVATELAVQLPALTGIDLGYRIFVAIDACGGTSARTEDAALRRIVANGGSTVCVMTLAGELAGDFREAKAQEAIGILFAMAKA